MFGTVFTVSASAFAFEVSVFHTDGVGGLNTSTKDLIRPF